MSLEGKRVLVVGGTGFIGGRLAERLVIEHGAKVRVPVRDWRKAVWISRTVAELVPGQILDAASMESAVSDCEIVFHCASGPADTGGYLRTNRDGTANVVAACERAGVRRLVYVSTVAVHGARPGTQLSSDTPVRRTGRDYSDSKIVAEELVRGANSGLETVVVRPTYVWGPRSNAFTIRQLREMMAGTFKYVDAGRTVANAVYVDNLVDALIGAATSTQANGRSYLVTDGSDYSWRELFDGYARLLGIADPRSIPSGSPISKLGARAVERAEGTLEAMSGPRSVPVRAVRRAVRVTRDQLRRRFVDTFELDKFAFNQAADIDATRRDLEYQPRFDLATGMAETSRWVEDQLGAEIDAWRAAAGNGGTRANVR